MSRHFLVYFDDYEDCVCLKMSCPSTSVQYLHCFHVNLLDMLQIIRFTICETTAKKDFRCQWPISLCAKGRLRDKKHRKNYQSYTPASMLLQKGCHPLSWKLCTMSAVQWREMNNDLATHIARESAALLLTKKIMNININSIISSRHQYINLKIINILFIFFFVFVTWEE